MEKDKAVIAARSRQVKKIYQHYYNKGIYIGRIRYVGGILYSLETGEEFAAAKEIPKSGHRVLGWNAEHGKRSTPSQRPPKRIIQEEPPPWPKSARWRHF